jgi:hypothetical protein
LKLDFPKTNDFGYIEKIVYQYVLKKVRFEIFKEF